MEKNARVKNAKRGAREQKKPRELNVPAISADITYSAVFIRLPHSPLTGSEVLFIPVNNA